MVDISRSIFLLLVAFCFVCAVATASPPPAADLDKLEGYWSSVGAKTDPDLGLIVSHQRKESRVVKSVIRLKVGGPEGYVDYIGEATFEATTGNSRIVLNPLVAEIADLPESLEYRLDGNRLLLWIAEGKHKRTHQFQRSKKE